MIKVFCVLVVIYGAGGIGMAFMARGLGGTVLQVKWERPSGGGGDEYAKNHLKYLALISQFDHSIWLLIIAFVNLKSLKT